MDSKIEQRKSNINETQPEKLNFGPPPGPPKCHKDYDGHSPLEYAGLEAVAHHLAEPKSLRQFKSDSDLAKYFRVTRMTIHRSKKNIDVIKRANWLAMRNKLAGDLIARREYPSIVQKAVEMAQRGNIKAMEFCAARAWPKDQDLTRELSLDELIAESEKEEEEVALPTYRAEQIEDQKLVEREAPEAPEREDRMEESENHSE
jgi:hypothetical protein